MLLCHYDDKKGKSQSHEVYIKDDPSFIHYIKNADMFINSHDISDIRGYGETEEEAFNNFMIGFSYIIEELRALEQNLLAYQNKSIARQMTEVDCFGNEIKEKGDK